jgi:predicted enzyme related to lactoylglutathione lyase
MAVVLSQLFLGVQDIYYNVRDMKRAVAFYRDVLGCSVVDESPYWSSLQLGGVRLGLHWTGGGPVPATPRDAHGAHAGGTLTLRVSDVDAAAAHLTASGTRLLGPIMREAWGQLLTFEDPDGNVLKLMKPGSSHG